VKRLPIYPEIAPVYRNHPGVLLSPSELYAAIQEYRARAEETSYYYDRAVRRSNFQRAWFFAQSAKLLERQRELFMAVQDALQPVQAVKIAA